MRWFNAILGRIFLAVYRTSSLESYITSRIVRKLKRVKIPSMLSEIQVREVDVGSSTPLFSKPMLKELTTDGEASMEVHVSYVGAVRITIETVATVSISSRFKPYSVRLVLAVVLQELEGTLLLKIKKPPSNRIWFGFTTMPKIKMAIEPLVSTRQIKWSLITSPIESRIREVVRFEVLIFLIFEAELICFIHRRSLNRSSYLTWTTSPSSLPSRSQQPLEVESSEPHFEKTVQTSTYQQHPRIPLRKRIKISSHSPKVEKKRLNRSKTMEREKKLNWSREF